MNFREKIDARQFVLTLEVEPPKGVSIQDKIKTIEPYRGTIDAFNATELQGSVMRMSSLGMCALLERESFPTILQVTARDKNRLALQSELLSAYALGIRNILALTGDHPTVGDHPDAKPVFDLDSVLITQAAATLNQGKDLAGNPLKQKPDFLIGAAVNPFATPYELELMKMKKKMLAGARFFQTQPVFEPALFKEFMRHVKQLDPDAVVLAGLMFIKSEKMAQYINENIAGIHIPDHVIERIRKATDKKEEAVRITAEIAREIKEDAAGFHLMAMGWETQVASLLPKI